MFSKVRALSVHGLTACLGKGFLSWVHSPEKAVTHMRIDNSPLISHITPETFFSTLGIPMASEAEAHWSPHKEAHSNNQQLAASTNDSQTTVKSKLDRVSEPKLQINKEATKPNSLYGVSYQITAPGVGLSNITFPMSIDEGAQRKSDKDAGIYYAMHFGVNDEKGKDVGRGYIGMQPRGDGKALITFSGFGPHFSAPKGRPKADREVGASNSTLVDFKFGNKYNLTIERDPENPKRLKAHIQDVTDPDKPGPKKHVEDLDVDQKFALADSDVGFVEHYGKSIDRSSQIAPTGGSFFAPFTVDEKGNVIEGSINSRGLMGRYQNSLVGTQEITKSSDRRSQVKFSFQGVGHEKKV